MSAQLAIPRGSTVLVTGATGYIGSWVVHEFAAQGYITRAVVRSQEKADILKSAIEKEFGQGKIEFAFIKDFTNAEDFRDAVKGVSAIVHLATDASFSTDPDIVVKNTVNGLKGLLDLAKTEPSVKRFVYTSSSRALAMADKAREEGLEYSPKVWNQYAVDNMHGTQNPFITYSASKVVAERAFWAEETSFVKNSILPDLTIGPAVDDKLRSSTHAWVRGMFNNDEGSVGILKLVPYQWSVDVRDVAKLHVGAAIFEQVQNKRLLAFEQPYSLNKFLDTMHKIDPERKLIDKEWNEGETTTVDVKDSLEVLKLFGQNGLIGYEDSIKANLA